MAINQQEQLRSIRTFPSLVKYLRDEMEWPIESSDFEALTFDFTPEELGIDAKNAAKIQEIKRLRPLSTQQPWGIFFVKFEPKRLPVVALRRLLSQVALKKRASANSAERAAWDSEDLLFVSNFGEGESRQITFAHFSQNETQRGLPTLKVLGWDSQDTFLHLDHDAESLICNLAWQREDENEDDWRKRWRSAFTLEHREVITTSKRLSEELARLARNIRTRIITVLAIENENGPVSRLMAAFKVALVHDLDEDGFADMYAQTIAYGLLSARMITASEEISDDIADSVPITNPFLKELMASFVDSGCKDGTGGKRTSLDFDELGLSEVVALLDGSNMGAVLRDFGDKNPQEDPVIHFFEGFLQEYDKKIKKGRGVFYTPRPVVSFIVRSVDELLRTEFGLEYGLADTTTWGQMVERTDGLEIPEGATATHAFVQILDPATGTGTFLVEVIDLIHKTMEGKWQAEGHGKKKINNLWNDYVPEHLLPRLHGYELMMAPYSIAHMKIGLKLYETGYRFESDERARVYLTNALEPFRENIEVNLDVEALAHESKSVNIIKRDQRFTVVIGNPPYSRHSSNNAVSWIVDKVHEYKAGIPALQKPAQGKALQDDYVKFVRYAQLMVLRSGIGVVGNITSHGFLDNPTFLGMRRSLITTFDSLHIMDLHGNLKKKETCADGSKDENVFGCIQQGVAVSFMCRTRSRANSIHHADLYGLRQSKYDSLTNESWSTFGWVNLSPIEPLYLLAPHDNRLSKEYDAGKPIQEIMCLNGDPAPGVVTTHDSFAISWTEEEMKAKVRSLLASQNEEDARKMFKLCSTNQWSYSRAINELGSCSWKRQVTPIYYRPFDMRWTVYNSNVAVHRRDRVMRHMLAGANLGIAISKSVRGSPWRDALVTRNVTEFGIIATRPGNSAPLFPLYLYPEKDLLQGNFDQSASVNLNHQFVNKLTSSAGLKWLDQGSGDLTETVGPEDLLCYFYAQFYSQTYRNRYGAFLKMDFPRVFVTGNVILFRALTNLGSELVEIHLAESQKLENFATTTIGAGEFEIEKVSYSDETVWIDKANTRGFKGVQEEVWNFHIGGYQVCHKWLKDRQAKGGKNPRPGRVLTDGDIVHYQKIVTALSETIRIMAEIDEVIDAHGGWPKAFENSN